MTGTTGETGETGETRETRGAGETTPGGNTVLDMLLASAHSHLAVAVSDRLTGQGGIPELRDPDLALDRLLSAAHRTLGHTVAERHSHETRLAREKRGGTSYALLAASGTLANRPAAVRLRYRRDALRIARTYWPRDLVDVLRTGLRLLHDLETTADAPPPPGPPDHPHHAVRGLNAALREVFLLPGPRRRPANLTGTDYPAAVEAFLAPYAEQLRYDAQNAREFLNEELAPLLAPAPEGPAGSFPGPGADMVAQDLADDLELACGQALALSQAATEVERLSSDFVGADLRGANLDGVLLEGIRWDAATLWPARWEELIRRVSLPADGDDGVLVITAEPHESAIPADK
ncbi:hypothetical protein ACIQNU_01615 [Streptomyces sp. NPDC091292]|uniref:hypothetical protein n=1 Tax=Streptomyces sp. NPDC091292 TaxID=3365991 RepID=UPI0037FFB4FA